MLAPIVLLVLLPAVLGLDRYVVTDRGMDGSLGRGSVALAREVPQTDLRVGDVITFAPTGSGPEHRVTRRIVALHEGVATLRSDTGGGPQQTVPLTGMSYDRIWLAVPWIGYPFLLDGGWVFLALAAVIAFALAMAAGRRQPATVAGPTGVRLPVG